MNAPVHIAPRKKADTLDATQLFYPPPPHRYRVYIMRVALMTQLLIDAILFT